jgi:hypothetical protein
VFERGIEMVYDEYYATYNGSVVLFKQNVHGHHVHFEYVHSIHFVRVVHADPHEDDAPPVIVWLRQWQLQSAHYRFSMSVSPHFLEPEDFYSLYTSPILILNLRQLNSAMFSHSVSLKSILILPYLSILALLGAMNPFGTTVELYLFLTLKKSWY